MREAESRKRTSFLDVILMEASTFCSGHDTGRICAVGSLLLNCYCRKVLLDSREACNFYEKRLMRILE
jgi:hypothetical protein